MLPVIAFRFIPIRQADENNGCIGLLCYGSRFLHQLHIHIIGENVIALCVRYDSLRTRCRSNFVNNIVQPCWIHM
ncbi:hypothetical protein D3C79_953830 [compost metagenome]